MVKHHHADERLLEASADLQRPKWSVAQLAVQPLVYVGVAVQAIQVGLRKQFEGGSRGKKGH